MGGFEEEAEGGEGEGGEEGVMDDTYNEVCEERIDGKDT